MASIPEALGGFADYSIGDVIGSGLAGPLRAARYLPTGHLVTIEELPRRLGADPAFRRRLAAEAQRACALRSPFAFAVYDLLEDGDRVALVTERVAGTPLSRVCDDAGENTTPIDAVAALCSAVLGALADAHRVGVIHAAIAPATVFVLDDGDVRIGGFAVGAAMHPEIAAQPSVDTAAVAALAAALSGSALEARARAGRDLRPIQRTVRRGSSPDPQRRFKTATGMQASLSAAAARALGPSWADSGRTRLAELAAAARTPAPAQAGSPRPAAPASPAAGRRRRRWGLASAIAFAAIALGTGAGVMLAATRLGAPTDLALAGPLTLQVQPQQGSCETTFEVAAVGTVRGTGTLMYRWERSDGLATASTALQIPATDTSFRVMQSWPMGSEPSHPAITFRIVSPAPVSVTRTLPYSCP